MTDDSGKVSDRDKKPNQKEQFKMPKERISKYFAPGTPAQKIEDTIIKALELYRKRQRYSLVLPLHTSPPQNYLYYPKKRYYKTVIFTPLQQTAKIRTMKLQRRYCRMKKTMLIAVLAAFIVSLSGCANTEHPQTIQDSSGIEIAASEADVSTVPERKFGCFCFGSKESSADSTVAVKAETESV